MMHYAVRPADSNDYPAIRALLADQALPIDDVAAGSAARFSVAIDDSGAFLGCAAIEPYGADALFRSVAVVPEARGSGLGAALVQTIEQEAAALGISRLFLLTTSADRYFSKLGYRVVRRSEAPIPILATSQFKSLCPASAVCMMREIGRA